MLRARTPQLAALLREDGVPVYSPARIDTLADPIFTETDGRRGLAQPLADQWRALIVGHPMLYLRQRAAAFRWVLLTPKPSECVMAETGVDGDPDALAAAGLTERQTARDKALGDYAEAFDGTPVFSHAVYGFAAIGLAIVLILRRRAADIAVAAMLGGALRLRGQLRGDLDRLRLPLPLLPRPFRHRRGAVPGRRLAPRCKLMHVHGSQGEFERRGEGAKPAVRRRGRAALSRPRLPPHAPHRRGVRAGLVFGDHLEAVALVEGDVAGGAGFQVGGQAGGVERALAARSSAEPTPRPCAAGATPRNHR